MNLKKCILTANDCYKQGKKITDSKPVGIVVHSTGANNPYIKRYVQPLKSYPDHQQIIEDLGTNTYGNHWNQSNIEKCVHGFIGKNAVNEIETCQTLPFDMCCWGCGSGPKGSYNNNPTAYLQFEICEDALTDAVYFSAVYKEATEFCAYLCEKYGISTDNVIGHYEAHNRGYGTNHSDPGEWFPKFGKSMDTFRKDVKAMLKNTRVPSAAASNPADPSTNPANPATPAPSAAPPGTPATPAPQAQTAAFQPYLVRVTAASLNVRKGPGTDHGINAAITDRGVYTVVEESSGKGAVKWGKLKSGAGWISLDYTQKVKK